MHTSFTSRIRLQRMNVPSWLAFVAVIWWAALLNPAQAQPRFAAGLLDGIDLPAAVTTVDRHPSLQTNDRRRSESARDGNPPAAAIATGTIEASIGLAIQTVTVTRPLSARPVRSPAQPRAPPAEVSAHAG